MQKNGIEIRKVRLNEINQLQIVSKQTFLETFSSENKQEDISKYIEESFSVLKLTDELNNKNSTFYFAIENTKIIGYLKLNFGQSQSELRDDKALEIERIYVLKDFLGKSIGQLLYNKAIQVATHKNVEYIWLGVWQKNLRAIQFYKKNGFVEFGKHIFKLGNDNQIDLMMKFKMNNKML